MGYSKKCKSKGLTLIEVIASIALLSTLLVMMLTIHSRHVRQINLAFEKQASAELLEGLLADWFSEDEPFPTNRTGGFPNNAAFFWKSTQIPSRGTNGAWIARTIRVEVILAKTNEVATVVEIIDSSDLQSPSLPKGG